jgi:hypothetical protein
VKNQVPKNYIPTLGTEPSSKTMNLKTGEKVTVQIRDTSSSETIKNDLKK